MAETVSKIKFRPHSDILNRIVHDPSYEVSQFVVGYLDRFDGITEISVMEWMERRHVSHEEFVPGHRIVFFKRIGGTGSESDVGSGEENEVHERSNGGNDHEKKEKKMVGIEKLLVQGVEAKDKEEDWDGILTEDIEWEEWTKRGLTQSVDISGNGKTRGKIVWDRRKRIDLIFGSGEV